MLLNLRNHRLGLGPATYRHSNSAAPSYAAETVTWESRIAALGGSVAGGEKDLADALILAIQSASYGSKIIYLMPFIGESIAAHRVPLRDSLGVGAAVLGGSAPFTDSNCSTAGGLNNNPYQNAWLDTGIKPSQLGSSNNGGLGWYERDISGSGPGVEPIGAYSLTNSPDNRFVLDLRAGYTLLRWGGVTGSVAGPSVAVTASHYYAQRSSATLRKFYKDGSLKTPNGTASDAANGAGDRNIYLFASNLNTGSPDVWNGRCACAYMTDGTLSDADVSDLHTLIGAYLITPTGR